MTKRARPDDELLLPEKKKEECNLQGVSRDELLAAPLNSIEQFDAFPLLSILAERAAWAHTMGHEEIQQLVLPWLNAHDELVLATTCRLLRRFYHCHREHKVVLAFRRDVVVLSLPQYHRIYGYKGKSKAITHATLNALHGTFTGDYRSQGVETIAADFIGGQFKYAGVSGNTVRQCVDSLWWQSSGGSQPVYEALFTQAPVSAIKKSIEMNPELHFFANAGRGYSYSNFERSNVEAALHGIARRDRIDILAQLDAMSLFKRVPSMGLELLQGAIRHGACQILRYLLCNPEFCDQIIGPRFRQPIADLNYDMVSVEPALKSCNNDALVLYLMNTGIDQIIHVDAINVLLCLESILGQDNLKNIIIAGVRRQGFHYDGWVMNAAQTRARRCFDYILQVMKSSTIYLPKKVYFTCMECIIRTSDWEWFANFYDSKYHEIEQPSRVSGFESESSFMLSGYEATTITWIMVALHYKVNVDFLEKMLELIDSAWLQATFQSLTPDHYCCFFQSLIGDLYRISAESYNDYFDAVCELLGKRYPAIRDILSDKNVCRQLSNLLLRSVLSRCVREKSAFILNNSAIPAMRLAAHIIDRCGATTDYNEELVVSIFETQKRMLDFYVPIVSSSSWRFSSTLEVFDIFRKFIRCQLTCSAFSSTCTNVPRFKDMGRALAKLGFDDWCARENIKIPTAFFE